jgi:hypothetical protein
MVISLTFIQNIDALGATFPNARGAPPPLDNTFAPSRSVYLEQSVTAADAHFIVGCVSRWYSEQNVTVGTSSATCPCPGAAVSRAVERFAEQHVIGPFIAHFPKTRSAYLEQSVTVTLARDG